MDAAQSAHRLRHIGSPTPWRRRLGGVDLDRHRGLHLRGGLPARRLVGPEGMRRAMIGRTLATAAIVALAIGFFVFGVAAVWLEQIKLTDRARRYSAVSQTTVTALDHVSAICRLFSASPTPNG